MRKNNKKTSRKTKTHNATHDLLPDTPNQVSIRNSLKPRTKNQTEYIRAIAENTITFCQGFAGSGKTHVAVGMGIEYLLTDKVKKIIITRPVVEAGEKIGYLPGSAEEKLNPYLLPILDEINHFITPSQYMALKLNNKIEVVPLGLMRGRNFHNTFIIADECQNATYEQLKMLLTRIGRDSKMILTGDVSQSDLRHDYQGGFKTMINVLGKGLSGIGLVSLEAVDIIRNPIIGSILYELERHEKSI